jgi:hypothetical protein
MKVPYRWRGSPRLVAIGQQRILRYRLISSDFCFNKKNRSRDLLPSCNEVSAGLNTTSVLNTCRGLSGFRKFVSSPIIQTRTRHSDLTSLLNCSITSGSVDSRRPFDRLGFISSPVGGVTSVKLKCIFRHSRSTSKFKLVASMDFGLCVNSSIPSFPIQQPSIKVCISDYATDRPNCLCKDGQRFERYHGGGKHNFSTAGGHRCRRP